MIKSVLTKFRKIFFTDINENLSVLITNQTKSLMIQQALQKELKELKERILAELLELRELKTFLGLLNYKQEENDIFCNNTTLQEKAKNLMAFHLITDTKIKFDFSREAYQQALTVFNLLTPMNVLGKEKVRLGAKYDGGYITIDPEIKKENDGIAYSFGISTYDPWSLEMVKRGYNVYQYDGFIKNGPYIHPMIYFFSFIIWLFRHYGGRIIELEKPKMSNMRLLGYFFEGNDTKKANF